MYERNRKLLPDRLFPFSLPSIHRIFRTQPFACTAGTFSFRAKRFVEICSSLQAIRTFCYGNLADETSTDTSHTGRKRERERALTKGSTPRLFAFFASRAREKFRSSFIHESSGSIHTCNSRPTDPLFDLHRPRNILFQLDRRLYFCSFFFFFFYDSWVLRTLHGRFVKRKIISSTELFSKV